MSTRHPDLIWIFAVLALAEPVAWGIQGTTPSDLTLVALNPKLTKAVTANDSTPGTTDGFITPGGDNGAPDPTWTDDRLPGTEMRLFVTEDFGSEVTGRYKLSGGRCGQISPTNTASVECPIEVVASFVPYCGTAPVSSSTPCDQASRFDIHFRIRQAPGITIPGQPPLKTIQTWSAGGIQGIAPTRLTLQQILDAAPLASPSPGASAAPVVSPSPNIPDDVLCEIERASVQARGGITEHCTASRALKIIRLVGNIHSTVECRARGGTVWLAAGSPGWTFELNNTAVVDDNVTSANIHTYNLWTYCRIPLPPGWPSPAPTSSENNLGAACSWGTMRGWVSFANHIGYSGTRTCESTCERVVEGGNFSCTGEMLALLQCLSPGQLRTNYPSPYNWFADVSKSVTVGGSSGSPFNPKSWSYSGADTTFMASYTRRYLTCSDIAPAPGVTRVGELSRGGRDYFLWDRTEYCHAPILSVDCY